MFWFVIFMVIPFILGFVFVGLIVASIVKLISFLIHESKKESMKRELEFKEKTKMYICAYCGANLKKDDKECFSCGAKHKK